MCLLIESMRDMVRAKHASDVSKCMYATIRTLPINKSGTLKKVGLKSTVEMTARKWAILESEYA